MTNKRDEIKEAILKERNEILELIEPYSRVSSLHNYGPAGLSREEKVVIRTALFIIEEIKAREFSDE